MSVKRFYTLSKMFILFWKAKYSVSIRTTCVTFFLALTFCKNVNDSKQTSHLELTSAPLHPLAALLHYGSHNNNNNNMWVVILFVIISAKLYRSLPHLTRTTTSILSREFVIYIYIRQLLWKTTMWESTRHYIYNTKDSKSK